jgi:hypothetical protein
MSVSHKLSSSFPSTEELNDYLIESHLDDSNFYERNEEIREILQQDHKDAKRYRWLRNSGDSWYRCDISQDELDEAIDRQIYLMQNKGK